MTTLDVSKNTALTDLYCQYNQLTTLDVSKNINLINLDCSHNQLTTLSVVKETALPSLYKSNQLTILDVSQNTILSYLDCSYNELTTLDVSKNTALVYLYCNNNQLTSLSLKNGTNVSLNATYSSFINNPNLIYILVDDVAYSNANWATLKDATATYTTSVLGLADVVFSKMALYPNPTKGQLHIDNVRLQKTSVYDALGKLVKTKSFGGESNNILDLSGVTKGVYFIYLQGEEANIARKIVVE